ncbi:HDR119Cp [Eremothecium sinecaudum]|uniref:HDR119Cp n=1 Tax=Eremothecium sinecaudum TaxID=45286 RepID=A0A0X8HS67_9SACH|nr:HDR119Cp [Eremothecium sinecaudum]AMD20861.1 HDR119Cp [Eremothecium sinecaudum]
MTARSSFNKFYDSRVFRIVRTQWLLFGFSLAMILGRFFPNFASYGGTIRSEYSIGYGAVAFIFFSSGLSISTRKLIAAIYNWRAHFESLFMSFLVTSAIVYGLCCLIKASPHEDIDDWMLVGLIMTGTCPTTIATNVTMTMNADGNELLAICQVFIGNLLGAFITPALGQLYTTSGPFKFGNPANGSSVKLLYAKVLKKLGLSVFLPLIVGQVLQNMFRKRVAWLVRTFRFKKLSSLALWLIIFSSMSTIFEQKVFNAVSKISIIFLVFFNLGLAILFLVISYCLARPWPIKKCFQKKPDESSAKSYKFWYHFLTPFYFNRRDTVAMIFCGGAKTAALGVSLITSQYGEQFENVGKLLLPLIIYPIEQILVASILVSPLKRWCYVEKESAEDSEDFPSDDIEHYSPHDTVSSAENHTLHSVTLPPGHPPDFFYPDNMDAQTLHMK